MAPRNDAHAFARAAPAVARGIAIIQAALRDFVLQQHAVAISGVSMQMHNHVKLKTEHPTYRSSKYRGPVAYRGARTGAAYWKCTYFRRARYMG